MTPAELARYFELTGRRVVSTPCCYWYEVEPRVFNSIPFHREVLPEREELAALWSTGALAARYPSTIDSNSGVVSVHYVCQDKEYSLARVPSANSRNHVRRGQRQCEIRTLSPEALREQGWALHEKTITRQGRLRRASERHEWAQQAHAMERVGGFDFLGAYVGEQLAALVIGFLIEDCYQVSTVRSDPELFAHYPNDVLVHEMLVRAMALPTVRFASYGFESVRVDTAGLHRFKLGLGFQAQPVRQNVSTRSWIKPVLPALHMGALICSRALPRSAYARQCERVLAFARASRR